MDFGQFFELLIGGITIGCIYSLIALGFSMIMRATDLIHFAQGEVVMVGSMIGLTVFGVTPLPYIAVFFIAMALTAVVGLGLEVCAYRRLRNRNVPLMNIIIATVGMSIFLQNVARLIWGSEPISYPPVFEASAYTVAGVQLPGLYVWVMVLGLILMVLLQVFFQKTRRGLSLQAAAQDPQTAQLMGINLNRTISYTFAISGAMGGAAGVLLGSMFFASFDMGFLTGIKAFVAAVLGGLGSITGAMLGGVLFGILETFGAVWVSSAYKDAIGMVTLIIVLLFFPSGIMGLRKVRH